jgi:hypothetical protein
MEKECCKENLYTNRDPRNFYFDGDPRALYWYKYRLTHFLLRDSLKEGQRIDIPAWIPGEFPEELPLHSFKIMQGCPQYDIPIVIVGNGKLNPFIFDIRKKDRTEINGFNIPGKSATIAFSYNLAETCGAIFDRDCRRQDHLYISPISKIEECNYSVYCIPTPNQPLHVRLIHKVHEQDIDVHVPPFCDRESLTKVFTEGRIN